MFARATAGRFRARTMCDPSCAGVALGGDSALKGAGALSLGGPYWKGEVKVVELGIGANSARKVWEQAIAKVEEGLLAVYTDGSTRDDVGKVGGGWYDSSGGEGCALVGSVATV